MLLMKEDLFNHRTDDLPNPLSNERKNKYNRARALVNLTFEGSQFIYVKNETIASSACQPLKTIHKRANLTSKLYLH